MIQQAENQMEEWLRREYLPVINRFPEKETQEWLLRESTKTAVRLPNPTETTPGNLPLSSKLPKELCFLGGSVGDLGFDKLDLPQKDIEDIYLAFCTEGVAVPNTLFKIRHSVLSLFALVEPASGHEIKLPDNWRQVVRSDRWIGNKVVSIADDLSLYKKEDDGFLRREKG